MLSQLLFVRLKAAENALRDGRLDEAFRLAMAPDIREHRRGAGVLAALAGRFLERAREHYRAERFGEAMSDLDRADVGGGTKAEIAELRGQVLTVAAEVRRQEESRRERLDAAKRRIEGGSLAAGRKILEQASGGDPVVLRLRREADNRMEDVARQIDQAEQLLRDGQFAAAADRVRRAKSTDAQNATLAKIEARLCQQILQAARTSFVQGRLARAEDELACLGTLGAQLPERRELADLIEAAHAASSNLEVGNFAEARRHTLSLQRLAADARWVVDAADTLKRLDEMCTALRAGPLGERLDAAETSNLRRGTENAEARNEASSRSLRAEAVS